MDVLIIEDESAASDRLINLLREIDPLINVAKVITTVSNAKIDLRSIEADLIFMDIHLSDGVSFSIFESVKVTIPIIFTTSHDEYALEAFKVNSIDYLLKPISKHDLIRAIDKFNQLKIKQIDFDQLNRSLQKATYQKRFMVTAKDRIITVKTDKVAYFYAQGKLVYLYRLDGSRHLIDFTLQHLEKILDPDHFFRINRQFIINLEAIKEMFAFSRSRIKVSLEPNAPESAIVSSERAATFKKWLNK
ncbi:LytTR family DNA-binding domain-containing protein [Ekhidna sp. MALMAid0563]|uniref:LytR/AlgR family response regulator transcription factor n=1 Tax=Ekhidna sp. MALMAid0563 TaxID=3143937 RepID=UPI0032DED005